MLQFINVAGSISDRESAGTSVLFISADVAEGTARGAIGMEGEVHAIWITVYDKISGCVYRLSAGGEF